MLLFLHTIFCCSSRSPHQEAVFSWRLVIPGATWHFQVLFAPQPWTDTFPKSVSRWTWACFNPLTRRQGESMTYIPLVFFWYLSQEVQADQTACPVVVVGNPESMDHPKSQSLCLVGWTSRAYKISLPTNAVLKPKAMRECVPLLGSKICRSRFHASNAHIFSRE